MTDPQPPFQLRLTPEQQEMIHKITGEHAQILELTPDPGEATSGEGCGLQFAWRLSVDSGIPRQKWVTGKKAPPQAPDEGSSA